MVAASGYVGACLKVKKENDVRSTQRGDDRLIKERRFQELDLVGCERGERKMKFRINQSIKC